MEEALIEMYLAGVSVRRVEDITQAWWGTRVSASTVSALNQKIYGKINEWRKRPLVGLPNNTKAKTDAASQRAQAAEIVENDIDETLSYYSLPADTGAA